MAYIFVDDGQPEADEYDNNYIWFDEDDPGARRDALERAQRLASGRNRKGSFTWRHLLFRDRPAIASRREEPSQSD